MGIVAQPDVYMSVLWAGLPHLSAGYKSTDTAEAVKLLADKLAMMMSLTAFLPYRMV
jgi:hypothetical protein